MFAADDQWSLHFVCGQSTQIWIIELGFTAKMYFPIGLTWKCL